MLNLAYAYTPNGEGGLQGLGPPGDTQTSGKAYKVPIYNLDTFTVCGRGRVHGGAGSWEWVWLHNVWWGSARLCV